MRIDGTTVEGPDLRTRSVSRRTFHRSYPRTPRRRTRQTSRAGEGRRHLAASVQIRIDVSSPRRTGGRRLADVAVQRQRRRRSRIRRRIDGDRRHPSGIGGGLLLPRGLVGRRAASSGSRRRSHRRDVRGIRNLRRIVLERGQVEDDVGGFVLSLLPSQREQVEGGEASSDIRGRDRSEGDLAPRRGEGVRQDGGVVRGHLRGAYRRGFGDFDGGEGPEARSREDGRAGHGRLEQVQGGGPLGRMLGRGGKSASEDRRRRCGRAEEGAEGHRHGSRVRRSGGLRGRGG
mmetsp:Transcript_43064/g.131144  ORF Transcript_43064/g.131144 Transcript_43064/m.131144 type:complete len:288 (-) Transcript_43064:632-1495(-)